MKQKLLDALDASIALYYSGLNFPEETWERITDNLVGHVENFLSVEIERNENGHLSQWIDLQEMLDADPA